MYSNNRSVIQLAALLRAHGIEDVVLCPGSRNVPIVETLGSNSEFRCHAVTDERSAAFFALGLAQRSGRPAVVCCTSGTALLNIHPAVAEAFYQQIPLVVVSADRPRAWIGQMDGQTLPQGGVFNGLVGCAVDLPEIHTEEDEWFVNRLINEALLATDHHRPSPVHINIPLAEPLFGFIEGEIPAVRAIHRHSSFDEQLRAKAQGLCRVMVVVGQMPRRDALQSDDRVVWLGEHLANQEGVIANFDAVLYAADDEEMESLRPDLLISLGGHVVSKRVKKFLRKYPPREHWYVSPRGEVVDLFQCLSEVVEMPIEEFLTKIDSLEVDPQYRQTWLAHSERIATPEFPYSEMAAVGELMRSMPQGAVLHLANSSVVRYAQLFPLKEGVEVNCNRGTSGIEGSMSTAVGYASESDRPNFLVIGDLSFFYDMNALWNDHVSKNLRILLLNNGGGEIFHTLPGLKIQSTAQRYVVADHRTSARGWAEERGFEYLEANTEEQLRETIQRFTSNGKVSRPVLLEVFTERDADTRALKEYYHNLK